MKTCFAFVVLFSVLVGCVEPVEAPVWTMPTTAMRPPEDDRYEYQKDDIASEFHAAVGYHTYEGRSYAKIVDELYVGLDAKWVTYQVPMAIAMADEHARLVISQDLFELTKVGLERIGREPSTIRMDVCDRNFNWIAGTNDKGEIVVKP